MLTHIHIYFACVFEQQFFVYISFVKYNENSLLMIKRRETQQHELTNEDSLVKADMTRNDAIFEKN